MFHIEHNSDNYTVIDCCLDYEDPDPVLDRVHRLSKAKGITRFISTHPDEDHIRGLELLDDRIGILNFYCVKNNTSKQLDTDSFRRYCELRDDEKKAFYISKGCSRKWMNDYSPERGSAGINIHWPDLHNTAYKRELERAANGESPNNISAIIRYALQDGASFLWMGDLETDFMEEITPDLALPQTSILFAPHHGRDSAKVPCKLLDQIDPKIVVIGEAPSEHLNYYAGYNTITQNSAGEILFDCVDAKVHIFTSKDYSVSFLDDEDRFRYGYYYLGTLNL